MKVSAAPRATQALRAMPTYSPKTCYQGNRPRLPLPRGGLTQFMHDGWNLPGRDETAQKGWCVQKRRRHTIGVSKRPCWENSWSHYIRQRFGWLSRLDHSHLICRGIEKARQDEVLCGLGGAMITRQRAFFTMA